MSAIVWLSKISAWNPALRVVFFFFFFFMFLIQAHWSHGGDGNGTVLVFQTWSRFAAVAPVKSNQAFGGRTDGGN